MPKDVNPKSDYPDNSRLSPDAKVASTPAEPGQGRLDEKSTWDKDEHPWPDVPSGRGFDRPDLNQTPGLAPGSETHAALKDQLTPDVQRFSQVNSQGGPESGDGYIIPPDGKAANLAPAPWGPPWGGPNKGDKQ
jgi:hypothetical protein